MLDPDVMLGEGESRILSFTRGREFLIMHDVLVVPFVPKRKAPVAVTRLNGKLDVIVLRLVAVSRSHGSHYIGAIFNSVACWYSPFLT